MKNRALTFGAFDLLHYGHMRLLETISNMAKEVYVGLATDEIIKLNKKTDPFYSYEIRREMLLHTRYVDCVLNHFGPVDNTGRMKIIGQKIQYIHDYKIDLIVMGKDWKGEYDFLEPYCEVKYVDRTPNISTTEVKNSIARFAKIIS